MDNLDSKNLNLYKFKAIMPFYKMKGFIKGDFLGNKITFIRCSMLAIIFGILASFIFVIASNANPFVYFTWVFKIAFNPDFIGITISYIMLYAIGALACAVGFKAKVFNIGIPGQMMLAGFTTIIIVIKNPAMTGAQIVTVGLIVSILLGGVLAFIASILKSYFGISEVVTTIMLNWIVFYFFKWLFVQKGSDLKIWDSISQSSIGLNSNNAPGFFGLYSSNLSWLLATIPALIIGIFLFFLINKTRFGYKMNVIGLSETVCKYSGINNKLVSAISLTISGAISGILGFLYYVIIRHGIIDFPVNQIPIFGLNTISVALIAFNNPVGIFFISIIWGILESGCMPASQLPWCMISYSIPSLIFGIVIYFSAIYVIFYKLKVFKFIKEHYLIYKLKDYKELKLKQKSIRKRINQLKVKAFKESFKIKSKDPNFSKNANFDEIMILTQELQHLKTKTKYFISKNYKEYSKNKLFYHRHLYYNSLKNNLFKLLNGYAKIVYEFDSLEDKNKKDNLIKKNNRIGKLFLTYKENNIKIKTEFKKLKNEFKNKKTSGGNI